MHFHGIVTHKRDINATILPSKGNTSPWMLPLLKTNLISLKPIFRGKSNKIVEDRRWDSGQVLEQDFDSG